MGRRQTDRRAECKCWPGKSFQSLALVCLAVDLQTGKLRIISDYDPHDIVTVAKEIIAIDNRNFNWFGKMDDWHETSPHPNLISGWCQVGEFSPDISNYTNPKCVLWPGCFQQGGTSTPQKVLSCNCCTCAIQSGSLSAARGLSQQGVRWNGQTVETSAAEWHWLVVSNMAGWCSISYRRDVLGCHLSHFSELHHFSRWLLHHQLDYHY